MQKNTPSEFARLGFSCLIQSALESDLYLQAPLFSNASAPDDLFLTASPIQKEGDPSSNLMLEWFLDPSVEEKDYFHLVTAGDSKRPRLLHLGENFEQNGDPITLVEKNHAFENTKIRFDEVPGLEGYYYMTFHKASNMGSRTTDSRRVVHVDQETKKITQWEKTPTPACYWRLIPASLTPADLISADEHNCFAIQNKTGGFLNLKGGSIFNGTQVTSGPFINQTHFKWRIKRAGDQYAIISARDAHHDRALQQHDNSQDDGAKITLWELDPEQKISACSMVKFEAAQDDGGHWCIIFCHSNRHAQLRLGELSQIRKNPKLQLEPNCCWSFVRCIPNFPKNA